MKKITSTKIVGKFGGKSLFGIFMENYFALLVLPLLPKYSLSWKLLLGLFMFVSLTLPLPNKDVVGYVYNHKVVKFVNNIPR